MVTPQTTLTIDNLITWMTENKEHLRLTEILAPLWDGTSHLLVRIESPAWRKVKTRVIVQPMLENIKKDEAQKVPAVLTTTTKHRKVTYVQTQSRKAPKIARKAVARKAD